MPRYPFYSNDYPGDFEDLSWYGGKHDFFYPRTPPHPNRLPLWNKYAYPDHLYGPGDPEAESYQVTEATDEMTDEEAASLSDGKGYPKLQPDMTWPLEAAGRYNLATLGFTPTHEDVGTLAQYPGLPRETIAAGDGDLNPGIRAMLTLFQDTLTLARPTPRQYWWVWYEVPTPHPAEALHQYRGQVDVYEYKWTNPGVIESFDPDVITGTLAGEEPYSNYKATTPFYWSGSILAPNWMNDPTNTTGVLPLTHLDGDEEEVVNRFVRWKQSRFFLMAHPSVAPPISEDASDNLQAHDNWITNVGRILLIDYEVNARRPTEDSTRRWLKKWG